MKSKLTGLVAVALLSFLGSGHADPVVVGGREWRQLTETMFVTWDEVAAVCPVSGSPCVGSIARSGLPTIDLTGWTWASNADLQALFDQLVQPGVVNLPTEYSSYSNIDDPDIHRALTAPEMFVPTILQPAYGDYYRFLNGWSANTYGTYNAYYPHLTDLTSGQWDGASLNSISPRSTRTERGVWLYRPYSGTVRLTGLTLKSALVAGCKSVTGTVTLSGPAPYPWVVVNLSDTLTNASVPATLKILAGVTTKTFAVTTHPVATKESGTVSATLDTTTLSQPLTVRPMGLASLTFPSVTIVGSQPTTGKVTLECKQAGPGPVTVNLASDNAAVASPVAASIVVSEGLQYGNFDVTTNVVQATRYATISGTANGITKSKRLTVKVAASVSPTKLSFGSVPVWSTSLPMTATLTNKGAVPFSISSIVLTGTYASSFVQTSTCAATLAAGASCEISVKFKPLVVASRSARLSIATSATVDPINVSLSGTGI